MKFFCFFLFTKRRFFTFTSKPRAHQASRLLCAGVDREGLYDVVARAGGERGVDTVRGLSGGHAIGNVCGKRRERGHKVRCGIGEGSRPRGEVSVFEISGSDEVEFKSHDRRQVCGGHRSAACERKILESDRLCFASRRAVEYRSCHVSGAVIGEFDRQGRSGGNHVGVSQGGEQKGRRVDRLGATERCGRPIVRRAAKSRAADADDILLPDDPVGVFRICRINRRRCVELKSEARLVAGGRRRGHQILIDEDRNF